MSRVISRWRHWDGTVQDADLALALVIASLIPALHNRGTQLGDMPARPMDALAVVVIVLECLPLVVRRRWPLVCLALVSVAFAADQLSGYHTVAGTALPIALISTGLHLAHHRRTTVIAATVVVLSQETVKTYVSRILTKLDLRDRVQAVVFAYRNGLVT